MKLTLDPEFLSPTRLNRAYTAHALSSQPVFRNLNP